MTWKKLRLDKTLQRECYDEESHIGAIWHTINIDGLEVNFGAAMPEAIAYQHMGLYSLHVHFVHYICPLRGVSNIIILTLNIG